MSVYQQAGRFLAVTTPLGPDTLLLRGFSGQEAISQLFQFQLDLAAESATTVPFDALLGQKITVEMEQSEDVKRYFSGICSRVAQGGRDASFTHYRLDVVPEFWFLTRRAQSRIFQQKSVPDILQDVLAGLNVNFQIEGTFAPRDFCVQYRETDFNFASRLMEEEGIFYFFQHSADGHKMVVGNTPQVHPDVPGLSHVRFEDSQVGERREDRITSWEKIQELRPGKVTLWDHCFEMPHRHLDADKLIQESVRVGEVDHKLKIGENEKLEIYDFPGEYAQRFDGVDPSGGDRSSDLQKIFDDNKRTAEIRMQEEAVPGLTIQGVGHCRSLVSGHTFTFENHFNANGRYVIAAVQHSARLGGDYRSEMGSEIVYFNNFTCIPATLPFRPRRTTPKPIVQGTQTAVVTGPSGEEIFTDKYGRVKVQFHWDRLGQNDANSSCWVRVGSFWAGKNWGGIHIPRIGQEVVVAFQEGDPDQPLIVGSVYNADMMPPYTLPDNKTQSGVKSRSTMDGTPDNFNELRFEDKKGSEEVYFHAEKDFNRVVENNDTLKVGFDKKDKGDQSIEIFNNQTMKVGTPECTDGSQTVTIYKDRTTTLETGNEKLEVKQGNRDVLIDTGNDTHEVKTGNRAVIIDTGNDTHQIKMGNRDVQIDMGNDTLTIKMGNQTTKLNLGASSTEAMQSIELKVGQNSLKIDQVGVTISGLMIKVEGQVQTEVKGLMTQINGDAMLTVKGGITMIN